MKSWRYLLYTGDAADTTLGHINWIPQIIAWVSSHCHSDFSIVAQVHSCPRTNNWLNISWNLLIVLKNTRRLPRELEWIPKALVLLLSSISATTALSVCHSQISMVFCPTWIQIRRTCTMMGSASSNFSDSCGIILLLNSNSAIASVLVCNSSAIRFEEIQVCRVWHILRILRDLWKVNKARVYNSSRSLQVRYDLLLAGPISSVSVLLLSSSHYVNGFAHLAHVYYKFTLYVLTLWLASLVISSDTSLFDFLVPASGLSASNHYLGIRPENPISAVDSLATSIAVQVHRGTHIVMSQGRMVRGDKRTLGVDMLEDHTLRSRARLITAWEAAGVCSWVEA